MLYPLCFPLRWFCTFLLLPLDPAVFVFVFVCHRRERKRRRPAFHLLLPGKRLGIRQAFFSNIPQFSLLFKRSYWRSFFLLFWGECLSNPPPLKGIPTTCSSRGSSQVNSLLLLPRSSSLGRERRRRRKEEYSFLPSLLSRHARTNHHVPQHSTLMRRRRENESGEKGMGLAQIVDTTTFKHIIFLKGLMYVCVLPHFLSKYWWISRS